MNDPMPAVNLRDGTTHGGRNTGCQLLENLRRTPNMEVEVPLYIPDLPMTSLRKVSSIL